MNRNDRPPLVVPTGPVEDEPGGWLGEADRETLLREALGTAGVELGGFDQRVLVWLAGWEPATVAVLVSWLRRANTGSRP